jgi:hypothetical protein
VGVSFALELVEAELFVLALAELLEGFALGSGGFEGGSGVLERAAGFLEIVLKTDGFGGEGLLVAGVGGEVEGIEGCVVEGGAEVGGGAIELGGEGAELGFDLGETGLGGGEVALALLLGAEAKLEEGFEGEGEVGHE